MNKEENNYIYPNFPKELEIKSQLYFDHYEKFINTRPIRQKAKFEVEAHHKIPRVLGGSNVKGNMIYLSYEDHFIAHFLLWKALGGKMATAFHFMHFSKNKDKRNIKTTAKDYAKLKKLKVENTSRRMQGHSYNKGRKPSEETKRKIGIKSKLFKHSEESKKKLSIAHKKLKISPITREACRLAVTGRVKSKEELKKISQGMKGKKNSLGYEHTEEWKKANGIRMAGEKNPTATNRKLIDPNGKVWDIKGLANFCRDHELSESSLRNKEGDKVVYSPQMKSEISKNTIGWTLLKV